MKSKAGHGPAGVYYCEGTVTEPFPELYNLFWPFVEQQLKRTGATLNTNQPKRTEHGFLMFLQSLKRVILQDAAYMLLKYPVRCLHLVFQLPLFSHPDFVRFKDRMKNDLEGLADPAQSAMNQALPGMRQHITENRTAIRNCHKAIGQV